MFILDRIKYRNKKINSEMVKLKIVNINFIAYPSGFSEKKGKYRISVENNINNRCDLIEKNVSKGENINTILKNGILKDLKVEISKEHNNTIKRKLIYKEVF